MSDSNPRPLFSVLVVNFNGGAYLQAALDSLAAQTLRDFEVLLVDNASTDGSLEGLRTDALPAFCLLPMDDNMGFAAANNRAADVAIGRWLALLNPDTEAAPDWLARIEAATRRRPAIRTFACAQIDLTDPTRLDGAGDTYLAYGIPWRGAFHRPVAELPPEGVCFSACGASAVYERDTFQAHGGFDERFFCYCEDVDLGFRLNLAGHDCVFLPDAIIHHAGGGLAGVASDFSLYHGARNQVWTYFKNMPAILMAITLPVHLALTGYLLIRRLMTCGPADAAWRGAWAGYAALFRIRRDSPWSAPERKVSIRTLARRFVWNPLGLRHQPAHVIPIDTQQS